MKYGSGYTCNVCGKYNRTSTLCHHDKLITDNMKKLPTAEEFMYGKHFSIEQIKLNMIEFAKLHVQAALESAAEKAELDYWEGSCRECGSNVINEKSILNAYPLDNIK